MKKLKELKKLLKAATDAEVKAKLQKQIAELEASLADDDDDDDVDEPNDGFRQLAKDTYDEVVKTIKSFGSWRFKKGDEWIVVPDTMNVIFTDNTSCLCHISQCHNLRIAPATIQLFVKEDGSKVVNSIYCDPLPMYGGSAADFKAAFVRA